MESAMWAARSDGRPSDTATTSAFGASARGAAVASAAAVATQE